MLARFGPIGPGLTDFEPHFEHRRRKATSTTTAALGRTSPSLSPACPHNDTSQTASRVTTPSDRMLPSVIGSIGFPSRSRARCCMGGIQRFAVTWSRRFWMGGRRLVCNGTLCRNQCPSSGGASGSSSRWTVKTYPVHAVGVLAIAPHAAEPVSGETVPARRLCRGGCR